jgi:hypothetical protein
VAGTEFYRRGIFKLPELWEKQLCGKIKKGLYIEVVYLVCQ